MLSPKLRTPRLSAVSFKEDLEAFKPKHLDVEVRVLIGYKSNAYS